MADDCHKLILASKITQKNYKKYWSWTEITINEKCF